ncbi:MAG: DUF2023 family protein [Candidatus Gastranaerophilaceae bacterium]|jgi:hypothetical protein
MQLFYHQIYEYQKGVRNLILATEKIENLEKIKIRLEKEKIPYLVHKIDKDKFNIYFGDQRNIDVVKTFNTYRLDKISVEQDFILGIMLGYDRLKQCERYLNKKNKSNKLEQLAG